jgi:hypothetical protein
MLPVCTLLWYQFDNASVGGGWVGGERSRLQVVHCGVVTEYFLSDAGHYLSGVTTCTEVMHCMCANGLVAANWLSINHILHLSAVGLATPVRISEISSVELLFVGTESVLRTH